MCKLNDIFEQLKDQELLIRCDAVSMLQEYNNEDYVVKKLVDMLNDKSYLVRCEVCDSLYGINSKVALKGLLSRLAIEKNGIVRMYLLSTIGNIAKRIMLSEAEKQIIYVLFKTETKKPALLAYYTVLYVIEKNDQHIRAALEYLDDTDYHLRCNVINLVNEVVDCNNYEVVKNAYLTRFELETTASVKELLKNSLINLDRFKDN